MDVFDLSAKITLNTSEYTKGLADASSQTSSIGSKIASGLGTAAKATAAVVGAASVAIGGLVKSSIDAYANYEQLVGGVETLFGEISTTGDASKKVLENASKAYKTAGLSANQYMETATSFAASLMASLENDANAAADAADMAVTDMADNANKMGTSMESIQNAYQGFAKQNYTMLDNLKLGYGGTKTEMERLLSDAQAITGVEYNIDNLNDVYTAIHVIQGELGITGTTAAEASTTISGSIDSMKASWENLLTDLASGNADLSSDIDAFAESVATVGGNIVPVAEQALAGVGTLIETLLPVIMGEIPTIVNEVIPELLESGANMVTTILQGISNNMPEIVQGAISIMSTLIQTILDNLPLLIETALSMITQLAMGIAQALPELIPTIVDVVLTMVETLIDNVDLLIDAALQLIMGLADGLITALPKLLEKGPEIITKLVESLINNLPKIIACALELMIALGEGLIKALPKMLLNIPTIISSIVKGIIAGIKDIKNAGTQLIEGLWNGIQERWSKLVDSVKNLGKNLVSSVKDIFGIHSPSRVFEGIGKMMIAGLEEGTDGMFSSNGLHATVSADVASNLQSKDVNTNNLKIDYDKLGQSVANALAGFAINMDGRTVAQLIAGDMNYQLGVLNARRV